MVAELPGVDAKNIKFEVRDDVLELSGTHAGIAATRRRSSSRRPSTAPAPRSSYHNGVFELKLPKKAG